MERFEITVPVKGTVTYEVMVEDMRDARRLLCDLSLEEGELHLEPNYEEIVIRSLQNHDITCMVCGRKTVNVGMGLESKCEKCNEEET